MGARKRSKHRNNPDRHKAFLRLREKNGLQVFTLKNGAQILVNPMKRFLLQQEYTHPELKKEVMRMATKLALGEKKYNELTQGE
ncbi:MAG: hypothetical protein DRJ01_06705 [Bacteroidetes bacterium]|nr:MAG: hypothetical protein DRJ01_06705 [Bacteroidota bacterium]